MLADVMYTDGAVEQAARVAGHQSTEGPND